MFIVNSNYLHAVFYSQKIRICCAINVVFPISVKLYLCAYPVFAYFVLRFSWHNIPIWDDLFENITVVLQFVYFSSG